jgi:hypothetical protein
VVSAAFAFFFDTAFLPRYTGGLATE